MLVPTDGVDVVLPDPAALAIASCVLIPGLYASASPALSGSERVRHEIPQPALADRSTVGPAEI